MIDHPIFALPKFGNGPGLYRVETLLTAMGLADYLHRTPRIAVAGTNGKGSTAKFSAEILRRAGRRTGLFTSPHLYRFNERIEVDGVPASDEILRPMADQVIAAVQDFEKHHPGDAVGAFEAFFLLAVRTFAQQEVDALVLEAGIGGRFDAVRLARAPLATVVSVDLDHRELLGDTLIEIAGDKIEITGAGGVVVLGPSLAPFEDRLRVQAGLLGVTVVPLEAAVEIGDDTFGFDTAAVADVEPTYAGRLVDNAGQTYAGRLVDNAGPTRAGVLVDGVRVSLAGRHQVENFAIAGLLAKRLLEAAGDFDVAAFRTAVRTAAAETTWPGRLELVHHDPSITIDVGHSPRAIEAALTTFAAVNDLSNCLLVLGCSQNKDAAGMVAGLAPSFSRILCTSAHHKGTPAGRIAELARAINPQARIETVEPIGAAAARALEICRTEDYAGYVAGGLFLAIEFAHSLSGYDAAELRFF